MYDSQIPETTPFACELNSITNNCMRDLKLSIAQCGTQRIHKMYVDQPLLYKDK